MINNINSYNGNYNLNSSSSSSSSEIDGIIEAHKNSNTTTVESTLHVNKTLYLSDRATKIHALSTEFFSNGAISFNDVNALKESAYQLGLISKQEYAYLTNTEPTANDTPLNKEMSTQTLATFAGDFIERLDATDVDENNIETESNSLLALTEALTTAKTILSDVDRAKSSPDFKESLAAALFSIKEMINADSFEIIPLDDKVGISKVYQALEIIDKISPKRLSNAKVNQYIQVSFN
ncbi:MAG: hypothetical protein COB45_08715 [Gammaproteobacteria bacterium]|nr:MAG: hypothetical protein COB45_08715 [Gammaproteobacteria bacterium]PHR84520.1 MAG: hypothetical protein COA59_06080 [Colwellia sp.]